MRIDQNIAVLRKFDIEVYFDLGLLNIVVNLMGISQENMSDSWMGLYVTELSKCLSFPIEPLGKNLFPIAKECYMTLRNFNFLKNDYDVGGALS
ncbi:MAG: hypothetical protein JXA68_10545 [Ignavibacteriales bacterium]|nr:hypothetical protein [Ignavibacteriales bacterium]